jgi:hypothetical protein
MTPIGFESKTSDLGTLDLVWGLSAHKVANLLTEKQPRPRKGSRLLVGFGETPDENAR